MAPFWPSNHTADLGLLVRGDSPEELFVDATKGLTLLLAAEYQVRPTMRREIEISAPDRAVLLVDFLSEILYLAQGDGLLTVKVWVRELSDTVIKAELGLVSLSAIGGLKQEIKAVTYHGLEIIETGAGLEATIVFDV